MREGSIQTTKGSLNTKQPLFWELLESSAGEVLEYAQGGDCAGAH
jgi:hypothetical protein